MSSADLMIALVKAHYQGQEPWFKSLVTQAAAKIKNERKRAVLLGQIRTLIPLPAGSEEFFVSLPPVKMDELILNPETHGELLGVMDELRYRSALLERGIQPRSRLLFHGAPGNGKTSAACSVAGALDVPAYGVSFGALIDSHMGVTGANLTKMFEALRAGALVVIDEFDALGAARDGGDGAAASKEQNRTVSTLLTLLDRVENGVLVATTNRVDMLDSAIVRRFDVQVEFAGPSWDQQCMLAELLARKYGLSLGNISRFAMHTATSYSAVAKMVLDEARREALVDIRKKEQVA